MIAAASSGLVLADTAAQAAELTSGTQSATRTARAATATGACRPARSVTAASRTLPSRHIDAAMPARAPPAVSNGRQSATASSGDWPQYGRLASSSRRSHPGPLNPAS